MDTNEKLAKSLGLKKSQVDKTVALLDEGNTIPFIARYRKEVTGGLSDEVLRDLAQSLGKMRNLEERKETVLASIEDQGKLTDDLKNKIEATNSLQDLEDLYLPYKKKRMTRASIAEDKGFGPLADFILDSEGSEEDLNEKIQTFIGEEAETMEEAIGYSQDIIAGRVSEDAELRSKIRDRAMTHGGVFAEKTKDAEENGPYSDYYSYGERIKKILPHRILAILRGEEEKDLRVKIDLDDIYALMAIRKKYNPKERPGFSKLIDEAIIDSYKRLLAPSIENQIKTSLKEYASDESIGVFAKNLRPYLMQSPMRDRVVLAMDPGFRTGCKLAVLSSLGQVLDHGVIFPTHKNRVGESADIVRGFISKYGVKLIAIGNGTASRETERFIVDLLKKDGLKIPYVIVNESGASIYSASKLGQEEFPDLDVTIRGAISIGRRIQDPLAELVKIEPKHIGVGQYQHDVDQKKLEETLEGVVEACVNQVGVDINTASASLLEYVAGLSKTNAKNIIKHKEDEGAFISKNQLKDVKGIGPKTFEQCAGFIRVPESDNPLDNTGIHPESYGPATALLDRDLDSLDLEKEAKDLDIGIPTLKDIIKDLKSPGRDPREDAPAPILNSDILSMDDLTEGIVLKGTVRNVVDFGCFVDIGVETDGLVHISEMSDSYVKHPSDLVGPGDIVEVKIIGIDKVKERISLSMKI